MNDVNCCSLSALIADAPAVTCCLMPCRVLQNSYSSHSEAVQSRGCAVLPGAMPLELEPVVLLDGCYSLSSHSEAIQSLGCRVAWCGALGTGAFGLLRWLIFIACGTPIPMLRLLGLRGEAVAERFSSESVTGLQMGSAAQLASLPSPCESEMIF